MAAERRNSKAPVKKKSVALVSSGNKTKRFLRSLAVWVLVVISIVAICLFIDARWVNNQVFNPNNLLSFVSPLPKQQEVATALSTGITDQIFTNVPVQDEISNALPPKASFLASPLTSQLKSLTNSITLKVIQSDQFQSVWVGANKIAINRVLAEIKNQTPPGKAKIEQKFNIDLGGAKNQLSGALGSIAKVVPSLKPASGKAITVSADLKTRRARAQMYYQDFSNILKVLPFVILSTAILAIAVSLDRRSTFIKISGITFLVLAIELIAIKYFKQTVLNQVQNPSNTAAVGYIYDDFFSTLKDAIYMNMVLFGLLFIAGVFAGPSKLASDLRASFHLHEFAKRKIFVKWREFRSWLRNYDKYFYLGSLVLIIIYLAFFVSSSSVNATKIINSILSLIILVSVIFWVSRPRLKTT